MNLLCSIRGHRPGDRQITNQGTRFSRCVRCGADLVRLNGAWAPPPKGQRIVWKGADEPTAERPNLPQVAAPTPAPLPRRDPGPEPKKPPYVLICDDDPLIAELLSHRLAGRGYRVGVAADGQEALASVAREAPDAILLDAMMPMVDGTEVLRRIRADPAFSGTRIIMLTARKQERDIVEALELGADDFVVKPFIPEELLSRLARLLAL
jgi:CheY-like chemotaxis protein